jgi:pimeloyl-ACP methyl ester carboxylesterase
MPRNRPAADGQRIRLPSGRRLGYSGFGDPDGQPVVYFHGGLSSRLDIQFADESAARLGVRLLAVDRPGVGLSDPQPLRRLLDWPNDVASLADQLGLPKFAVLGWSAGGPYVLACAIGIADRLSAAATVAGMAPLQDDANLRDLTLQADSVLFPLSERAPWLAAAALLLTRHAPATAIKWSMVRELALLGSRSDRAVVTELSSSEASSPFVEALRHGARGTVDDYRVLGAPWGFQLEDVDFDVTLFHGDEDRVEPPSHAEAMAARLPRATLRIMTGEGHFLLRRRVDDVLGVLVAP